MIAKNVCIILLVTIITVFTLTVQAAEEKQRILTVRHMTFSPYELSLKGFLNGIQQSEIAGRVALENYNAQNNINALENFIESLKTRDDLDLIFSIGTVTTKRLIKEIKDIPIVFTDLGAPEYSGVVSDWKGSGANYTGVETRNYVSIGINLLHELIAFNSIGMIYLKGAPSHEGTIKRVTELSREVGFEFVSRGFALRDGNQNKYPEEVIRQNIREALEYVAPKVDVFYVQISGTFDQNFDLFLIFLDSTACPVPGNRSISKRGWSSGLAVTRRSSDLNVRNMQSKYSKITPIRASCRWISAGNSLLL